MAKKFNVSSDGITWYEVPGSTSGIEREAAQVNDTLLAQTYQSNFPGIITWSISGNAFLKGVAGYLATIKKHGTSTAFTGQAMSQVSGQIYQIDNAAYRIWDRSATFTVYDGGTDVTNQVEWFDYLFGKIKFLDSYTVVGAITIDGSYFPTVELAKANNYTLSQTAEVKDTTTFSVARSNGGYSTGDPGLRNADLTLSGIFDSASNFSAELRNRNEFIVEIDPLGTGESIARGFYNLTTAGQTGDAGAVEEESLTFSLQVPEGPNIPFGWEHSATTRVPAAVKILLDAWANETKPQIQYLPDGVSGEQGTVVVTDVSLSGEVGGINEFSVSLQGDGALITV